MQYDPVKRTLGKFFNQNSFLRKLFYRLLDLLLLRAWHIHRELRHADFSNKNLNILDAGAGFGQYSFWMYKHLKNCNILSVDVKEEQIADCNNFFQRCGARNVRFEIADLTKFEKQNNFDLVLCVDVMEHIEDDNAVFRGFYRALNPGGVVVINTPSSAGTNTEHGPKSFIDEHARYGYPPKELRSKLEAAGLVVDELKFTYGTWGGIAWRIGIQFPMFMLNLSKLLFILLPFYYLVALPLALIFMAIEYSTTVESGGGLLVIARKP